MGLQRSRGWDIDRDDWRTFRLDRVADVELTDQYYRVRDLPADTAAQYLDDALHALRHRAAIVFHAGAQQMSDLLTDREGTLEPLVEDRCRYITWVDSFEWLAVSTAILDIEFHIEEPTGFTEYCLALAARLIQACPARDHAIGMTRWLTDHGEVRPAVPDRGLSDRRGSGCPHRERDRRPERGDPG